MNRNTDTVQHGSIEEWVGHKEVETSGLNSNEVILHIDGLNRRYIKVGDTYVRVGSFTDPILCLAPGIPRVVDVAPFSTDDEIEDFVENSAVRRRDRIPGDHVPITDPRYLLGSPKGKSDSTQSLRPEQQKPLGPVSEPLRDLISSRAISLTGD